MVRNSELPVPVWSRQKPLPIDRELERTWSWLGAVNADAGGESQVSKDIADEKLYQHHSRTPSFSDARSHTQLFWQPAIRYELKHKR